MSETAKYGHDELTPRDPQPAPAYQATGASEDGYPTFLKMGTHEIWVMVPLLRWREKKSYLKEPAGDE